MIAILFYFAVSYIIFTIFFTVALILFLKFGNKFLFVFAIVSLLTITSSFGEEVRMVIQVLDFSILLYLLLSKYGLNFCLYPKFPKEVIIFFIVFIVAIFLSFSFSNYPAKGYLFIFRMTIFFLIAYLVYSQIDSWANIKLVLFSLIIVSFIISISILIDFVQNSYSLANFINDSNFRSGGLITNVNAAGGLFAIIVPIILALYLKYREHKLKYIFFILSLTIGIGIVLSSSRAAFLSLFISILFIAYKLNRNLFIYIIGILIIIVIMFIFISPLNEFAILFFRIQDGLSNRDFLWDMTINIIKENWLFGVGPGAYGSVTFNYFPVMFDSWQGMVFIDLFNVTGGGNVSHNFYLAMFSELGFLGFISSIMLPIIYLRLSFKTFKYYKDSNYSHLLIGIIAVGLGMFVRANFDNVNIISIGYITNDLPFWIVFGLLMFLYNTIDINRI